MAAPLAWRAFRLPKHGHRADEYEDACAADLATRRFAVADGASESSFAGLWARLLVEGFTDTAQRAANAEVWLQSAQEKWAAEVDALALPWYAEEKRDAGAFATFVGLRLRSDGGWLALAVGDSCCFQVRAGELLERFPIERAADFDNRPALLASRPAPRLSGDKRRRRRGQWQSGDRFLLMTDALAQWFLDETERGGKPLEAVERLLNRPDQADEMFAEWIEALRTAGTLRNDDVTLVGVAV